MTWGMVAVAAATVVGSIYSSNKSSDAADDAAKGVARANSESQALNQQRFSQAGKSLGPFMQSEAIANKRLMEEMGLGAELRQQEISEYDTRITDLGNQIEKLRNAPPPQTIKKRKKKRGFLGGAIGGLAGGLVGDPITGNIIGHAKGAKSKVITGNYDSEIEALELKLKKELDGMQALSNQEIGGPSNAYMQQPGYQGAIDEGVRAVDQGAANSGVLYSGSRGKALKDVGQGVQQSYYNNYINMLQNMASPSTTTNYANIGIGQAGNIGSQNIASANQQAQYNLAGAEARGAAVADIVGAIGSGAGAYINRPQTPPPSTARF